MELFVDIFLIVIGVAVGLFGLALFRVYFVKSYYGK